jgi:hypothetical protein
MAKQTLAEFAVPLQRRCPICDHPERKELENGFRSGISCVIISKYLAQQGVEVSGDKIYNHMRRHCRG